MNMRARQMYQTVQQETTVATASPGELIIVVYERILDHLRAADRIFEAGGDSGEPISKAIDLIEQGLMASLDFKNGGELAAKLADLYDWSTRSILRARLGRDRVMLADVIGVLSSLLEGWVSISPSHNRQAA